MLRRAILLLAAIPLSACATAWVEPYRAPGDTGELARLHERFRVPAIAAREFTHAELWGAVGPLVDAAGRSATRSGARRRGGPSSACASAAGR